MCALLTCTLEAQRKHENAVIDLWTQGKAAFGVVRAQREHRARGQGGRGAERPPAVYTREGGEKLAMNPLYDFLFLNLEGRYDAAAIKASPRVCAAPRRSAARRSSCGFRPSTTKASRWRGRA